MTPNQRYVALLEKLDLDHHGIEDMLGISERTSRRWANDPKAQPDDAVMLILSVMMKHPNKLTPEVIKAARIRMAGSSSGIGGIQ
jgi:hypothetical protein